jgi:beta propeller repeat protein
MTTLALSLVGGASLLAICLFLPAQAGQNATGSQSPRWVQFPLAYYPALNADVYENVIIWSEYNGSSGYEFTCTLTNANPLHHSPTPALNSDYLVNFSQSGTLINNNVFPRQPPPPLPWDICLYDGQTGEITHLTNSGAQDQWPRIHGDWVVFIRGDIPFEHIVAKNLTTAQETTLPHGFWAATPNVHNDVIVYHDWDSVQSVPSERILAYDLTTQELMTITYSPNPPFEHAHVYFPDVYSGTIVWQQSPPANQDYDIISYDLSSQTTFTISNKVGNEEHPRIDGDLVVWDWQGNIYGYDLASGQRLTITQDAWFPWWPAVSGDLVVWMDNRNGRWDVYGYDLALAEEYWLTENASSDAFLPAVSGNLAAWDHGGGGAAGARKMTDFAFLPVILRFN